MAFNPYRLSAILAWSLAGAVLAGSFLAIVIYTANPWPWFEVVHESGDRSLVATIFFFEHAARELPLDMILGAAVAGSALFALPIGKGGNSSPGTGGR